MKLIFLDIDGVLNSIQSTHLLCDAFSSFEDLQHFCPLAANNLRILLREVPECFLVISSSWRVSNWAKLESLFEAHDLPLNRIVGKTPHLRTKRGLEIDAWLKEHATPNEILGPEFFVDDYVILDDDEDMEHLRPRLIHTDEYVGLTLRQTFEIIARFTCRTFDEVASAVTVF